MWAFRVSFYHFFMKVLWGKNSYENGKKNRDLDRPFVG